jgi:hypothetical protein
VLPRHHHSSPRSRSVIRPFLVNPPACEVYTYMATGPPHRQLCLIQYTVVSNNPDKGKPGQSRRRKATDPRLLRDALLTRRRTPRPPSCRDTKT